MSVVEQGEYKQYKKAVRNNGGWLTEEYRQESLRDLLKTTGEKNQFIVEILCGFKLLGNRNVITPLFRWYGKENKWWKF